MEKEKQPVLLAEFRMAVEKLITKFIGCDDDSLEFPCFFNSEQRRFIHEMCFKKGLKYKDQRKGKIDKIRKIWEKLCLFISQMETSAL